MKYHQNNLILMLIYLKNMKLMIMKIFKFFKNKKLMTLNLIFNGMILNKFNNKKIMNKFNKKKIMKIIKIFLIRKLKKNNMSQSN